jgi:hypothetical protein
VVPDVLGRQIQLGTGEESQPEIVSVNRERIGLLSVVYAEKVIA